MIYPYKARAVADLIPYARNARTHSDAQVAQIAASIREFGFINPVIVDGDNGIVAGHGRVLAARKLGIAEVPTIEVSHLTDAQRRAYVLADNKLALNAGWDDDLLKVELSDLKGDGFDIGVIGFNADELAALMAAGGAPGAASSSGGAGSLAAKFGVPPFSVLNAREGWWQDRKKAWIALGIQSELGRGENLSSMGGNRAARSHQTGGRATPGGSMMPAADYSKRQRGDGRGRSV